MHQLTILTFVLFSLLAHGQGASTFKSDADQLVSVRNLTVLPVFDNMRGIYARPVETEMLDTLKDIHKFEHQNTAVAGPVLTPDELEQNESARKKIAENLSSDAFISTSIIKGPGGISIKMSLFLKADQKLLVQESLTGQKRYDVETIKKLSKDLVKKLLNKLPYSGMVISRQGTRVTLNLGKKDGVIENQILSAILIIKLVRHPKFDFFVSAEKQVVGKIKLLKVDDTLSFGRIITEVESGAIQVNTKLSGIDAVVYANTESLNDVKDSVDALPTTPEGKATYGDKPIAWLPMRKPTFGMFGARLGLGQYSENVTLASGTSLDTEAPFYPFVIVDGELWLTPKWSMHAKIKQGILTTNNPVNGGSPSDLSRSLSEYEFLFGYNLRLSSVVNSARIEGLFGFTKYRLSTDISTPAGLTTKSYSGVKFGVAGSYPIGPQSPYSIGANLNFLFSSELQEKPGTSGKDDNSVNSFGFFLDKEIAINLRVRYALDFDLFSSDFSGGLASSSSQKHTSASAGIYYLF